MSLLLSPSLVTAVLTAPVLATSTAQPEPVITATPLEAAHNACAAGSTLCDLVTETTGSRAAGAWAEALVGLPLHILLIITIAVVLRWILHRVIARVVESIADASPSRPGQRRRANWLGDRAASVLASSPLSAQRRAQRARTVGSILRSVATGVIGLVTTLMVLSALSLDITPLLASAGIVGVAIGFGAQSLVKDFLSGIFMMIEDQYGVGDSVNLGDAVGVVEYVGLRVTHVRDVSGTLWYVPNGQITRVGNLSQGWGRALVDITVAHGQDVARASTTMLHVADELRRDPDWQKLMIDDPEIWGVEQVSAGGVTLRGVVKTLPTEQFKVARELRRRVSAEFEKQGISFPFAQAGGGEGQLPPPEVLEPPARG